MRIGFYKNRSLHNLFQYISDSFFTGNTRLAIFDDDYDETNVPYDNDTLLTMSPAYLDKDVKSGKAEVLQNETWSKEFAYNSDQLPSYENDKYKIFFKLYYSIDYEGDPDYKGSQLSEDLERTLYLIFKDKGYGISFNFDFTNHFDYENDVELGESRDVIINYTDTNGEVIINPPEGLKEFWDMNDSELSTFAIDIQNAIEDVTGIKNSSSYDSSPESPNNPY